MGRLLHEQPGELLARGHPPRPARRGRHRRAEVRVTGGHPVFKFGKHGMVYGHYVHPEYRGEGAGRALLEAAQEWFREKEMPFWRIEVLHGVEEEALYRDIGMKPMEVIYEKELVDDDAR
ncbi:GNAT family N-acetyltransferase [Halovenus salina]|uniref:GNAT family N-acetyltransferase n=1 Tax=Halovenus salina TaxID=1510225 RepID=A0ABD5W300_9EURY